MLTVLGISSLDDWDKRNAWIKSLPDIPKILCLNNPKGDTEVLKEEGNLKIISYNGDVLKEGFSKIRNYALAHVDTEWVCSLDMDEMLVMTNEDLNYIKNAPDNVGGFRTSVLSFVPTNPKVNVKGENVKIFRSKYRYHYNCHETVITDILKDGKGVSPLGALIRHEGYKNYQGRETINKFKRNITLLAKDVTDYGFQERTINYLDDTIQDYKRWLSQQ